MMICATPPLPWIWNGVEHLCWSSAGPGDLGGNRMTTGDGRMDLVEV